MTSAKFKNIVLSSIVGDHIGTKLIPSLSLFEPQVNQNHPQAMLPQIGITLG